MKEDLLQSIKNNSNKPYVLNSTKPLFYKDLFNFLSKLNEVLYYNHYKKVLICAPQGFYAYGSILASYITNATFCVINPDISLERMNIVLFQFDPNVILTYECTKFKETSIPKIELESIDYNYTDKNNFKEYFPCFENEIIYVYFTSGSTGIPKGCLIKRSALESLVLWAVKEFGLTNDEIWGQYAPLYFDMSLLDVFGSTYLGASLVSFPTIPDKLRPGYLIRNYKITFLNVVPQLIDILYKTGHLNSEFCGSLSKIKLGGDITYIKTVEQLFKIIPDLEIILTYGPTETTIFCTYKKINKSNYKKFSIDILTIGEPIPKCRIELVNIIDGIGEIVVYGECVGLGYIGQEQLGYNTVDIEGKSYHSYRTGDYAKKIEGYYYFCGRKDSQVKINGQRLGLIEIESALIKSGIEECATIIHDNNIIAFCVSKSDKLDTEKINEYLKHHLPELFLPKQYVNIDKIPYNANGKIDRVKLKQFIRI